jgi:hypothetical protein
MLCRNMTHTEAAAIPHRPRSAVSNLLHRIDIRTRDGHAILGLRNIRRDEIS